MTTYQGETGDIISSIRVEVSGAHANICVWSRGGRSGSLCVGVKDAEEICRRLLGAPKEKADEVPQ